MSMISYRACDLCDKPMQGTTGYVQLRLLGKRMNGDSAVISINSDFWKRKDGREFDVCATCYDRIGVISVQTPPRAARPNYSGKFDELL